MMYLNAILDFVSTSWPLLVAVPIFYLFFIRPQIKKQKDQEKFMESLEKGKEVVTSSGIIGRINRVNEHTVQLVIDNKNFLTVTKAAISQEATNQFEQATKAKSKE